MSDIAQNLMDAVVRAEHIIWLPATLIDLDALPEAFEEEFCEWLPEEADAQIYKDLPRLLRFAAGDEMPEPSEVGEALLDVPGFLVKAASPVRDFYSETGCQYGWGHYRTEWFYAATADEIGPRLVAFGLRQEERDKARWRAKAAAEQAKLASPSS